MRLTRTPIAAFKTLYKSTQTWANETISCSCQGKNILADVRSSQFDLTAIFDLNKTTAREIEFNIANRTIQYNIEEETLLGKGLKPDSKNHLTIRMLVDWSSLEVFAAGGVYSYSQQFAFSPEDNKLNLYTNGGEAKLVSLTLNEVSSIWPNNAK